MWQDGEGEGGLEGFVKFGANYYRLLCLGGLTQLFYGTFSTVGFTEVFE